MCKYVYLSLYINVFRLTIISIHIPLFFYLPARVINDKLLFFFERIADWKYVLYFSRHPILQKMVVYHHQQIIIQIW